MQIEGNKRAIKFQKEQRSPGIVIKKVSWLCNIIYARDLFQWKIWKFMYMQYTIFTYMKRNFINLNELVFVFSEVLNPKKKTMFWQNNIKYDFCLLLKPAFVGF